ncbi:hypothetical protein C0992_006565, partial [Termitomyces sp. T32_za158]
MARDFRRKNKPIPGAQMPKGFEEEELFLDRDHVAPLPGPGKFRCLGGIQRVLDWISRSNASHQKGRKG